MVEEVLAMRRVRPGSLSYAVDASRARGYRRGAGTAMSEAWLRRLDQISRPPAGVDCLLRACLADDRAAAAAWADFERHADFDPLPGTEMCLVGLVAKRLPAIAPQSVLRGRIGGIERAHWSRMRLILGETMPAVRLLTRRHSPVLLLGEAARIARGEVLGRGRRTESVDCCVWPADLTRAREMLSDDGWRRAAACVFARGRYGTLELLSTPFPPAVAHGSDAGHIWRRAVPAHLGEVPVFVPSATDGLLLNIADGMGRSCFNGLWLADIAIAVDGGIDWRLFEEEIGRHHLEAAAFHALLYANDRLGRAVPRELLDRLGRQATRR